MKTNQPTNHISKLAQIAALILLTALLAGCGNKVTGKYSNGLMTIEFKSDGTANLGEVNSASTETAVATYEIKDDKVIIRNPKDKSPADALVLTRFADGTLGGPLIPGGPFKKQ